MRQVVAKAVTRDTLNQGRIIIQTNNETAESFGASHTVDFSGSVTVSGNYSWDGHELTVEKDCVIFASAQMAFYDNSTNNSVDFIDFEFQTKTPTGNWTKASAIIDRNINEETTTATGSNEPLSVVVSLNASDKLRLQITDVGLTVTIDSASISIIEI